MFTSILMKSYHDLSKRKARSLFTILTITLGVMGMALFAVNPLAERTIDDEIEEQDLYNLRLSVPLMKLNDTEMMRLRSIENVDGVEPALILEGEIVDDDSRDDCWLVGKRSIENGEVDRVIVDSGSVPGQDQVLSEKWNDKNGLYSGETGDRIHIVYEGKGSELAVSGIGKSLAYREGSYDSGGMAVLYANMETISEITNTTGFNSISFRLQSTSDEDIEHTIGEIWSELSEMKNISAMDDTPRIRKNGEWPGGEFLDMFLTVMYMLTVLAVVCSVFFIYNTMNTIISEQRKEIATMKAIGASKLQVFRSYMTTSGLLGVSGALLGTLVGIPLTYILLQYFGGLLGFSASFSVHFPTVSISFVSGIIIVLLSSLPSIIKALRIPTREGMEDTGLSNSYGKGIVDKLLMRSKWMPRTIQLGFRNSSRRKGRSFSTILQITLAIGIFMGLVSFGFSVGEVLESTIDNVEYDIILNSDSQRGSLSMDLMETLNETGNITYIEPYMETRFTMSGMELNVMGFIPETQIKLHDKTMVKGEWINGDDVLTAVVGEQLSGYLSIAVGDTISVMTPSGPAEIIVTGIDSDFYYMGMVLYMPFDDVKELTGSNGNVTGFFIQTTDDSKSVVDATSMSIEDRLEQIGTSVEIAKKYRIKETTMEQNLSIINMMAATSVIIILISMVGLTSNLTMNILDRTREIGVMRCIGSVAAKIRRVFTTEVLTLSLIGWVLGIPLGYLMARLISWVIYKMIDWEIEIYYPLRYVMIGLFITLVGTTLIAQFPILRATRIKPGDAIRYQ